MTGRVAIKGDRYYIVLTFKDDEGVFRNKWISTGLTVKNNKRAANEMLRDMLAHYEEHIEELYPQQAPKSKEGELFSDYLWKWLQMAKPNLQVTTYGTYERRVKVLMEYFNGTGVLLSELKPKDIQDFYFSLQEAGKTVQECHHFHTIIHRALQIAYRADLIRTNPADKVERPKSPKYKANFYTAEQVKELFEKLAGDPYEYIYKLVMIYGLRRSEVTGLRWSSIDFNQDTITLEHAVVQCQVGDKRQVVIKDKMKNQSSLRTLPILPEVKKILTQIKNEIDERIAKYGEFYNRKYLDYVAVNELGDLIKPDTLTTHFRTFLLRKNLPLIRLHDLRHTCASVLIASGVSMKAIQEWLGHSTFVTTADIYGHLNYSSKLNIASTLTSIFDGTLVQPVKSQDEVIESMKKMFVSTELSEVGTDCHEQETTIEWVPANEDEEFIEEVDEIEQYRKAKEEMKRLGFDTLDEYFEYLDYKERKNKRNGGN